MKKIWLSIKRLWSMHTGFKIAVSYLIALLLLILLLPVLPLMYDPNYLDMEYTFLKPFSSEAVASGHILGTDNLGRDLLANMLYGARTAFLIALPVMLLTITLGLLFGVSAGYYGDKELVLPRYKLIFYILAFALILYYGVYLPFYALDLGLGYDTVFFSFAFLAGVLFVTWALSAFILKRLQLWQKRHSIPLDQIILRLTEGLSSIPRFVLILALASFIPPSMVLLSLLLVLTLWTGTARLARAEMLRIKHLPYFEAARSLGNTSQQLIWRHAIPNLLGPVFVVFTFGVGGLLALESTLSFLNIGVPTSLVSWGRTISTIRSNTSAWWLVVFPGTFLSVTVLALYTCSHYFSKTFSRNSSR